MFEIMIDTGGTFTDGVLADDKQTLSVAKAETVPADPAKSILNCITHLAEERSTTLEELLRHTSSVTIGTTLPTNCILERKGRAAASSTQWASGTSSSWGALSRRRTSITLRWPPPAF